MERAWEDEERKSVDRSRRSRRGKTYLLVLLQNSISLVLRGSARALHFQHTVYVARESAREERRVEPMRVSARVETALRGKGKTRLTQG